MIVSVPTNVCVVGHATGKAGELVVAGEVSHGVDPDVVAGDARPPTPRGSISTPTSSSGR